MRDAGEEDWTVVPCDYGFYWEAYVGGRKVNGGIAPTGWAGMVAARDCLANERYLI